MARTRKTKAESLKSGDKKWRCIMYAKELMTKDVTWVMPQTSLLVKS